MASSPAVIAFAQQKTMLISATYFICGIYESLSGALRGLGKPVIPTICTLLFMCLLRFVWVYAIFPLFPNLTFLYLVWPIGWVLSIAFLLVFYLPAISKLQKNVLLCNPKTALFWAFNLHIAGFCKKSASLSGR